MVLPAQTPGTFVDQELRGSVSDLLFEVRLAAGGEAEPQWLYVLFEHQSRPDRWMALRLLRYCCRIWEAGRRSYPDEEFLRPVLPLVFYQGRHRWRYAEELAESFPPALRGEPWVPRFRHLLFDQTRVAPEAVAGALRGRLLQLAMMHAFEQALRDARERMAALLAELQREPVRGGVDYVKAFMEYIMETGPADTLPALDEQMRRRAPGLRGELMTCGEMLRREGRREGRLETIEGLLREGVGWPVIQSATGIDEQTYRGMKGESAQGAKEPRPASSVPERA